MRLRFSRDDNEDIKLCISPIINCDSVVLKFTMSSNSYPHFYHGCLYFKQTDNQFKWQEVGTTIENSDKGVHIPDVFCLFSFPYYKWPAEGFNIVNPKLLFIQQAEIVKLIQHQKLLNKDHSQSIIVTIDSLKTRSGNVTYVGDEDEFICVAVACNGFNEEYENKLQMGIFFKSLPKDVKSSDVQISVEFADTLLPSHCFQKTLSLNAQTLGVCYFIGEIAHDVVKLKAFGKNVAQLTMRYKIIPTSDDMIVTKPRKSIPNAEISEVEVDSDHLQSNDNDEDFSSYSEHDESNDKEWPELLNDEEFISKEIERSKQPCWRCEICQHLIHETVKKCYDCQRSRPVGYEIVRATYFKKKKDFRWICSFCCKSNVESQKTQKCIYCNKPKSLGIYDAASNNMHDHQGTLIQLDALWSCPICSYNKNDESFNQCAQCLSPKDSVPVVMTEQIETNTNIRFIAPCIDKSLLKGNDNVYFVIQGFIRFHFSARFISIPSVLIVLIQQYIDSLHQFPISCIAIFKQSKVKTFDYIINSLCFTITLTNRGGHINLLLQPVDLEQQFKWVDFKLTIQLLSSSYEYPIGRKIHFHPNSGHSKPISINYILHESWLSTSTHSMESVDFHIEITNALMKRYVTIPITCEKMFIRRSLKFRIVDKRDAQVYVLQPDYLVQYLGDLMWLGMFLVTPKVDERYYELRLLKLPYGKSSVNLQIVDCDTNTFFLSSIRMNMESKQTLSLLEMTKHIIQPVKPTLQLKELVSLNIIVNVTSFE